MKCPKCGYLGFEPADRCRNCGYDFLLARPIEVQDLAIRDAAEPGPLDDLALVDAGLARQAPIPRPDRRDLDRTAGGAAPGAPGSDLPLFGPPIVGDEPLITRASAPRPPLAVRRATPDTPRGGIKQARAQTLDLALGFDVSAAPVLFPEGGRAQSDPWPAPGETVQDASLGARCVAAVIDLMILAAIDAVVISFTMQICGITIADVAILPKGPLVAFLFVQNGGYLVAFTAGGQTLGKMATGIKVVSAESNSSPELGRALLRTVLWLMLAIPAGLGFLTTLFSRDHRGLHDRFAGTRVVRATPA